MDEKLQNVRFRFLWCINREFLVAELKECEEDEESMECGESKDLKIEVYEDFLLKLSKVKAFIELKVG